MPIYLALALAFTIPYLRTSATIPRTWSGTDVVQPRIFVDSQTRKHLRHSENSNNHLLFLFSDVAKAS
jgi:hypothetical protein